MTAAQRRKDQRDLERAADRAHKALKRPRTRGGKVRGGPLSWGWWHSCPRGPWVALGAGMACPHCGFSSDRVEEVGDGKPE
jgi:hypothetical protein